MKIDRENSLQYRYNGTDISFSVDRELNNEEIDLISSLLVWSRVDNGIIDDAIWKLYVKNEGNDPEFSEDGTWSLDNWEQLFVSYN